MFYPFKRHGIGKMFGLAGPFAILLGLLGACSQPQAAAPAKRPAEATARLKVVATTTIVGDVVSNIGGDLIDLTVLMQPGIDPHSFEFTPQDVANVADSDVVFVNGAGLEEFLTSLLQNAGKDVNVVPVSEGIKLLPFASAPGAAGAHESGDDPHVWWNPLNVMLWADTIAKALSAQDAANGDAFAANASAYKAKLHELDSWIKGQVDQLPQPKRKLVTDHDTFGYLADHYGFELVGAVLPNASTQAEPSAQELAALQDAIKAYGVKAIFVGTTVNPALAQRVADDTGTKLVFTYTDALGEPGGNAGTYLDFMRSSVTTIVGALK